MKIKIVLICLVLMLIVPEQSKAYNQLDVDCLLKNGVCNGGDLSNASLRHKKFSSAQLTTANLTGADLSHSSFVGSNFSNADLSAAVMSFSNFSQTNLSRTNLSAADISHSNLSAADLSNANLTNANVKSVMLKDANMKNTDLTNANFEKANLASANLTDAKFMNTSFLNALNLETAIFPDDINKNYILPYLRDQENMQSVKAVFQSAETAVSQANWRLINTRREYNTQKTQQDSAKKSAKRPSYRDIFYAESNLRDAERNLREAETRLREAEAKLSKSEAAVRNVSDFIKTARTQEGLY